ncbi:MAG: energy-coupling factor transporter ATPase [Anaerofustis stercorihominis]|nr:energy-coupling factor transporter ATPase [Anaerofustis stercorihominis]
MSIEVRNLSHVYSLGTVFEHTAIDDINFDVGPRDFIGIIGHTGCGKSTLIQHLNGLLKPTKGTVVVNGKDINKDYPMKEIVKRVGIVFQYPEYQLFEETVYKDVAFGPKNIGFSEEEIEKTVRESIELVGLDFDEVKDQSPFDLSGGQKRRVAIAGVLAMKPQILILDEPASGLDPMGRSEILGYIHKLNKEVGICILLVSHNMDDVADYADKVMVFSKGKLVMYAPPKEVFADVNFLEGIGLTAPDGKKVLLALKERGIDVDTTLFRTKDAIEEILRVVGGKK